MNIRDAIMKVNENIYDYRLKDLAEDLFLIMNEVNSTKKAQAEVDAKEMNSIFKVLLQAMERRDYLLLSDILIHELLPMVEENNVNV